MAMSSSIDPTKPDRKLVVPGRDEFNTPEYAARYRERFWKFCLEALEFMATDPEDCTANYWNSQDETGKQFIKDHVFKHVRIRPHLDSTSDANMLNSAIVGMLLTVKSLLNPHPKRREARKRIRAKSTGNEIAEPIETGKPKRGPNPLLEKAILKSASIKMEDFRKGGF